jgi:DNA-binding MurR/RpiR family transcriptional regulator
MTDKMRETLEKLLAKKERIVFTGHSSGGAVASFLYTQLYKPGRHRADSNQQLFLIQFSTFQSMIWTASFSDRQPIRVPKSWSESQE